LVYAETLIRTAQARFKSEEIDYLELTDKMTEALQIRLEYLEILNNYNQSAVQLEYYAY
jgi:cobalt-zinc-cadmium resistance protein CzcA